LSGKRATSYPGRLENMRLPDVTLTGEAVTRDGNVITSRGAGTALDFALTLIEALDGKATRDRVEQSLVR
jgi:4-methyl-5(b-hydroxyethyl)-thiazole monophosphate biosynthesis